MDSPDKPAAVSFALAGDVQDEPEKVISVVVTNKEDEPVGLLEKWNGDAWFYAEVDSFEDIN